MDIFKKKFNLIWGDRGYCFSSKLALFADLTLELTHNFTGILNVCNPGAVCFSCNIRYALDINYFPACQDKIYFLDKRESSLVDRLIH